MEQTEAILINRRPWSDTSLLTVWFSPLHGKLSAMARSARKPGSPFAGRLDLFHRAEIGFARSRKSSLHALREVRLIEPFGSNEPASVFLCGYFAELVDLITHPGEPSPEIYGLLARAVSHLGSKPATLRAMEFFEDEVTRLLGVGDGKSCALAAIETYCGKIPASRKAAMSLLPKP